jgi:signal transduction histidine kinase
MINLLRNSVKFTTEGIIRLTAESMVVNDDSLIGFEARRRRSPGKAGLVMQKWLKLTFYDTGMGIKEQDLKNLFKIFGKLNDPQ